MDALAPAATVEHPTGELVDDLHLAALDDVVLVALVQLLGLQGHRQLVHQVLLHLVVEVVDAERLFDPLDAVFERHDDALVFFDLVVDVTFQRANDRGEPVVQLGGVGDTAADDQRRARLVDEDRVDLVDDRVVVAALHLVGEGGGHVVAQVVEAELVVGAVGDVAGVVGPLLARLLLEPGDDQPDIEAHPLVDPTHPLGVEACQVVVDGDEVHAVATEAVEVRRQRADQRLALAGLHLGDPAEVQRGAAHQLHVEVALTDHPLAASRTTANASISRSSRVSPRSMRSRNSTVLARRASSVSASWPLLSVDVGNQALEGLQFLAFTSSEDAIEDAHAGAKPTGGGGADLGRARSACHGPSTRLVTGLTQLSTGRGDEFDVGDAGRTQRTGRGAATWRRW